MAGGGKSGEVLQALLKFGLALSQERESDWYKTPRTDYSCIELRRALAANNIIARLLPEMNLEAVFKNDPLSMSEFQRDQPGGFERGTRGVKWLLGRMCHEVK